MPILTLTTDFGSRDGFVGTMKGVILGICPQAQIVDISHEISPQNVRDGAFTFWRAYPFFPPGTIHIAVVDPGVGTSRRALAAKIDNHFFVGPDNGIFTLIFKQPQHEDAAPLLHQIINPKYFLNTISNTFHGRDIFSPAGAHLANGVQITDFGPSINDPVMLAFTEPEKNKQGWMAHIAYIDHFGNCTTDLRSSMLEEQGNISFLLRGIEVNGISTSYGNQKPGTLIALEDSEGFIEISKVNGSAAEHLGIHIGDNVEVTLKK